MRYFTSHYFKPLIVVAFFMLQLFNKIYQENNSIEFCYKCCGIDLFCIFTMSKHYRQRKIF